MQVIKRSCYCNFLENNFDFSYFLYEKRKLTLLFKKDLILYCLRKPRSDQVSEASANGAIFRKLVLTNEDCSEQGFEKQYNIKSFF